MTTARSLRAIAADLRTRDWAPDVMLADDLDAHAAEAERQQKLVASLASRLCAASECLAAAARRRGEGDFAERLAAFVGEFGEMVKAMKESRTS